MENLPFKTIHASVRPARIATLLDKSDQDWQDTCLRVIEFYSQLWGGAYNIIVPTDGSKIDERFWTLLETFDPDYVCYYQKSLEDLFRNNPGRYAELLEQQVDASISQGASLDREALRAEVDKNLRRAQTSQFWIATALQEQIRTRLAPFWFREWAVEAGALRAASAPRFPFTDITKIIGSTEHPDRVNIVQAPTNLLPTLWFSAVTGHLSAVAQQAFDQSGVRPEPFLFQENDIGQLIDLVITGDLPGSRVTPYSVTMLQLGLYRSARYQDWQEPVVAVAGTTLDDFCLYYCISRLRDRVVWVLPSLTEKALAANANTDFSRAESNFLRRLQHAAMPSSQFTGGLACLSHSLDSAGMDGVVRQMNRWIKTFREPIRTIDDVESLVRLPLTAVERDNWQRDVSLQFVDDRSISLFNTPKLKHFAPDHPYEQRYITQLSVVGDAPPKHFHLGTTTVIDRGLSTKEARVGKEGPAYFCPNVAYFGGDIDTILVKPRLHLPPLYKIVEQLALTRGYECRPSDKGIYADESISKWGGLEEIGRFLRNAQHYALLDRFLDVSKSEEGKGVYLADRRRYLDFVAIKAIAGDAATSLIDELISKQVLYRGFIFGCSYCRNADWFAVGDVTEKFKCRRCGRSQIYRRPNWKKPDEPAWFYKLDELIYQGYRQGMAVSILALDYLRSKSESSFTFATDREFWKLKASKPDVEVDFVCSVDGVFTVGEAKTQNNLGGSVTEENAKLNKYKLLVEGLSIRQLVFATMNNSWRRETVEAARTAFSKLPYVQIVFLDGPQIR